MGKKEKLELDVKENMELEEPKDALECLGEAELGNPAPVPHYKMFFSARLLMMLMCTTYVALLESLNGTLSFAWVCMTKNNETGNVTGELNWDNSVQTRLFIADTASAVIFLIPVGQIIDRWGAKTYLVYGLALASLTTMAIPPAAKQSYWIVVGLRALLGIGYCGIDPAIYGVSSQWAPKKELGFLYALGMSGFQIGPFSALLISGVECDTIGWPWVFYLAGTAGLIYATLLFFFYTDDPESSRFPSKKECHFIMTGRDRQTKIDPPMPWKAIFTSLPVWAIFYNSISCTIVNVLLRRYTPSYILEVLKVSATDNGFFTSMTYIAQLVSRWIAGPVSDLESSRFTNTLVTKIFNTLSYGGTGLCLIGLGFVRSSTNEAIPVVLLIGAMFFLTFYTAGFQKSVLYIAPELSGTIFSISLVMGQGCAVGTQYLIGYMTQNKTDEEWRHVMYVIAAVSFSSALVYILFGSGELQPWAVSGPETEKVEEGKAKETEPKLENEEKSQRKHHHKKRKSHRKEGESKTRY